jgi:hypothetical protein
MSIRCRPPEASKPRRLRRRFVGGIAWDLLCRDGRASPRATGAGPDGEFMLEVERAVTRPSGFQDGALSRQQPGLRLRGRILAAAAGGHEGGAMLPVKIVSEEGRDRRPRDRDGSIEERRARQLIRDALLRQVGVASPQERTDRD